MSGDEQLVREARNGSEAALDELLKRYKSMVRMKASAYFFPGYDKEDIVQEGMIGLYKAVRDYDFTRQVQFNSFAALCVTRQIISALKAARRQKHMPLNTYRIFDSTDENKNDGYNPEAMLIGREEKMDMEHHIRNSLSMFESEVLSLYLQGHTYMEIAQILGKDIKSVDNTLQRIRRKVSKIIGERGN